MSKTYYTTDHLTLEQARSLVQNAVWNGLLKFPDGATELPRPGQVNLAPVMTWSQEKAAACGMTVDEFKAHRKRIRERSRQRMRLEKRRTMRKQARL